MPDPVTDLNPSLAAAASRSYPEVTGFSHIEKCLLAVWPSRTILATSQRGTKYFDDPDQFARDYFSRNFAFPLAVYGAWTYWDVL